MKPLKEQKEQEKLHKDIKVCQNMGLRVTRGVEPKQYTIETELLSSSTYRPLICSPPECLHEFLASLITYFDE